LKVVVTGGDAFAGRVAVTAAEVVACGALSFVVRVRFDRPPVLKPPLGSGA
jgi:hypothetical protein